VLQRLIALVTNPSQAVTALYLLNQTSLRAWSQMEIELLLVALRVASAPVDLEYCSLVLSPNPLLLCIAYSELCKYLRPWSRIFREHFTQLSDSFLRIALHLQAQHNDYIKLKAFYMDPSYGGKNAFDLLCHKPEEYRELLMCETVVNIAKDLWRSEEDLGIGVACCYFAYLAQLTSYETIWTLRVPLEEEHDSLLQFHIWKRDGFVRHMVETCVLLAMFLILVYILHLYLQLMHLEKGPDILVEMNKLMNTLRNYRMLFAGYCFSLIVSHLQAGVHLLFLGNSLTLNSRMYLDALIVACISVTICFQEGYIELEWERQLRTAEWLYAALFFFIGLRILMVLLETETFGPILRMIFLTVRGVLAYLLIYLLTMLVFALSFTIIFWRNASFESIEMSIRTLFTWSVGNLDPSIFTDSPEAGSVLSCAWALVSAVLLLNLLVAVLSMRLEHLSPQARADYVAVLYRSYTQTRFEPMYGALVVAPAPFNVLTLPALLLYVLLPGTKCRVTQWFAQMSYQLVFAVAVVLYTCMHAVLFPVAYVLAVWRLCRMKGKRAFSIVVWLALGPIQLLLLWGYSYKRFFQFLYAAPTSRRAELSTDFFKPLKRHLHRLQQQWTGPCLLSLADLAPTLTPFPRWRRPAIEASTPTRFFETAERIYFSSQVLKQNSSSQTLAFLQRFKGIGQADKVDIKRVVAFMEQLEDKPDLLLAANISAVQIALQRARTH